MNAESLHRLPFRPPSIDRVLFSVDQALRTLTHSHRANRPSPCTAERGEKPTAEGEAPFVEDSSDQRLSAALMRVNHVGEVCAQALYSAQSLTARNESLRQHFDAAAREEVDHLVWTEQRLKALNSRPSLLNPLWYAGAFGIGLAAGALGERASLGFVIETERQVEEHLASHLERLPSDDEASRAIVRQMREDEARHADEAADAGGERPPKPVRWLMRAAAKVMTVSAHHI